MNVNQEHEIRTKVEETREKIDGLTADLCVIDQKFEKLAPQREQNTLLETACSSIEELERTGAGALFWGEAIEPQVILRRIEEVRSSVDEFNGKIQAIEQERQAVLDRLQEEKCVLELLGEDLYDIEQEKELKKLEWEIEREISEVPIREQRMAWARGGEEDRRFYRSLAASLLLAGLLGGLLPMIDLPLPKKFIPDEMPKRLAKLVRPEKAKPLPTTITEAQDPSDPDNPIPEPDPVEPPDPSETVPDVTETASTAPPSELPGPPGPESPGLGPGEPTPQVATAGILAFKDKFASLAKDDLSPRLGNAARLGDADDNSRVEMPTRSMLTSNQPGSSGGINIGTLSRNVGGNGTGGGGGGGGLEGVQVGRATSGINTIGGGGGGGGGGDRPRAGGGSGQAPTRTDEEIQIVFDRYKASFYRLYNRELRNDPTLRGQLVLNLTIEPDGNVSMCRLQSSDMNAPDLAAQVVNRVRQINFGAKEGVKALTIVYPIDFLPRS